MQVATRDSMFPQVENKSLKLVKLPWVVYQAMYDATLAGGADHIAKRQCLEMLQDYIFTKYPGYGIVAFEDFSKDEALKVSERTGYVFSWGMYIIITQDHTLPPAQNLLDYLQSPKLIYDGSAL